MKIKERIKNFFIEIVVAKFLLNPIIFVLLAYLFLVYAIPPLMVFEEESMLIGNEDYD